MGARDRNEESAVSDLIEQSDMARLRGAVELAMRLRVEAVERAEALSERFPEDPRHLQTMASALYAVGQMATDAGEPADAIDALDDCQDLYEELGEQGAVDAAPLLCDVAARRARALSKWGKGASAVVDVDRAVRGYRKQAEGAGADDPVQLDLARVLVAAAVVQLRYGDPDLAVGAADAAIRIYFGRAASDDAADDMLVHANYLTEALVVAELVHGVHGRSDIASAAANYLSKMMPRAESRAIVRDRVVPPDGLLLGDRAPLSSTLAEALLGVGEIQLARELTKPAIDCVITVPSERCEPDVALSVGANLARVALEMPTPADKLRTGLEAHWLLTAATELDTAGPPFGFGDAGIDWLRALRAGAELLEGNDEQVFALDLMWWAGGVGQRLTPYAFKTGTAREICDAFELHARMLDDAGEPETANQARKAVTELRRVFPHTG